MQPYQEATEEIKRQVQLPLKLASNAASIAGTAATAYLGGGVINRVLPFLSKYIPENLVKKGLEKIDPRYGKFIDKALSAGKSIEDIKDFIGSKIQESPEAKQVQAKDNRNVIQMYSPELFQFLEKEVNSGRPVLEAGAIAETTGKFRDAIKKMIKDHKTPFSSILQTVFGQGLYPGGEQKNNEPHANSAKGKQLASKQFQTQQQGSGQSALMQALQAARNRKR